MESVQMAESESFILYNGNLISESKPILEQEPDQAVKNKIKAELNFEGLTNISYCFFMKETSFFILNQVLTELISFIFLVFYR